MQEDGASSVHDFLLFPAMSCIHRLPVWPRRFASLMGTYVILHEASDTTSFVCSKGHDQYHSWTSLGYEEVKASSHAKLMRPDYTVDLHMRLHFLMPNPCSKRGCRQGHRQRTNRT